MIKYEVGQEVAYARFGRWADSAPMYHGFAKVEKVNGHGHIFLDNGKVFNKHGRERGHEEYGPQLISPVDLRASLQEHEARKRRRELLAELKSDIDHAYSRGYKIPAEMKQKWVDLINSL